MKKYMLIWAVICLLSGGVLAKPNVFCKNEDSLDDFCMVAANVMYEGYMKGFTGSFKKNQKDEILGEREILNQAQELIPYSIFHSAFQFCGEKEESMKQGQICLVNELREYILVKFDQKSSESQN